MADIPDVNPDPTLWGVWLKTKEDKIPLLIRDLSKIDEKKEWELLDLIDAKKADSRGQLAFFAQLTYMNKTANPGKQCSIKKPITV